MSPGSVPLENSTEFIELPEFYLRSKGNHTFWIIVQGLDVRVNGSVGKAPTEQM